MNKPSKINPKKVIGKYYVDQENCMNHACCVEIAPNCFKMDERIWSAYVYKQPETTEEETLCQRAMAWCPERAILDNGESEETKQ